jgi:DNA-binding transcriptional regulator YiaG
MSARAGLKGDLFHYTQSGLDDVWLADGVQREETDYGSGFRIERANELHEAIARSIINDSRPLRGQEARFLRVLLNLSQEAMAKALGVDRATIIRWERARARPLGTIQDIAVRTTYAARSNGDDFVLKVIKELQNADEKAHGAAYRQVFETSNQGWREKRAA